MIEVRKQDGKIEALRASIDSNEAIMNDLMSEMKKMFFEARSSGIFNSAARRRVASEKRPLIKAISSNELIS